MQPPPNFLAPYPAELRTHYPGQLHRSSFSSQV
jgi:hypothetical protein